MKKTAKKLLGALLALALALTLLPAAALADTGVATIVLSVPTDVWEDSSGYQMLLDSDHDTFGRIIPESGPLAKDADSTPEVYAEFEYKLPGNADYFRDTQNALKVGTMTMTIPAGTYDWCITNPTPNENVWIAGTRGNVKGRADDYAFEAGKTYTFEMRKVGDYDGVFLTITDTEEQEPEVTGEVWPNVLIPEKTEEPKDEEPAQTEEPVDVDEPTEEEPVDEEPTDEPVDEPIDEPADEPQEDVPTTGDAAATVLPALAVLAIMAAAAYVGLRKRA